jgi:hypothetical protein
MSLESILERLHQWSVEQPHRKAWTFLTDKGDIAEAYTYQVGNSQLYYTNYYSSLYCYHSLL